MRPGDIGQVITVTQPAVAPDGHTIAFVVSRADADANTYRSQVWLAAGDGSSPPAPFTSGEHADSSPAWSPTGDRLAFASDRTPPESTSATGGPAKHSVCIAPVHRGGEVVTVARLAEPATDLHWSPDGRFLSFVSRTRADRYADDDPKKQPPRRITKLFSRLDNVGFTVDRPRHTYIVPADGSAPARDLTPGEHELVDAAWTPDNAELVVSGGTHDTWDLDLAVDLFAIDVATGERRPLSATDGLYSNPSVSPDGTKVAFLALDDHETSPRNTHIGIVDRAGGPHTYLSRDLDRTFAPFPGAQAPHWLDDDTLLVSVEDRGDVHLYTVTADGSAPPRPMWTGEGTVTGYHAAGGTTAFTLSTPTNPGELYVLAEGDPRRLTDITSAFATLADLRPYEHFTFASSDGSVELDGWALLPPDHDPTESYPALVNVHGGPFTQYANRFFDEVQIQTRAGYIAVWCNPRGSSGREESFGRAICGEPLGGTGWGSVDYDDVMALVDHAQKAYPSIDPDRIGILGGSYGGYMTSWAIGHTDRFRAACSERACNNVLSLEWASDAAGAFRTYMGKSHLEAPELYEAISPITYVQDITTPLLILHSEEDLRCPIEQADQLFVALRMLRREVEFVRFPAESHELSRSGSPRHRIQRAEIILEFFDRHLKEDG